jgi:hypothetical protein
MKVKQIISELGPSNGSLAPIQNGKQQYKVSPNSAPAAPGQSQMIKLVPAGAPQGTPGQDPQGTVTVSADQIDMSDPANPKLNPQALNPQAQTPNQQSGALNGKTVTMGLGEEPNEDLLQPTTDASPDVGGYRDPNDIPTPSINNTLKFSMKGGKLIASDGDEILPTSTGREVDQQYVRDPINKMNKVGYININGKPVMALNTGHKWKVGPQVYKMLTTNQPLQQEEQGDSPLSRIAHLAGIK